jgi:hypothetical protein
MGIRFFCPNGHKLNVKSFQAGRRGVCPHCGVGLDIPVESTRPSSRKRAGRRRNSGKSSIHPGHGDSRADPNLPLEANGRKAASVPGKERSSAKSPSALAAAGQNGSRRSPSIAEVELAPGAEDVLPLADAGTEAADPLGEAPDAVWYLRPPSGGQYGPATQQVMRAWLAEGRVTPDSLVWREGWRDWRGSAEVFPASAFPQPRVSDAVLGLDSILAEAEGQPLPRLPRMHSGRKSIASQLLIIAALLAVGAAVVGAVYFATRFF